MTPASATAASAETGMAHPWNGYGCDQAKRDFGNHVVSRDNRPIPFGRLPISP